MALLNAQIHLARDGVAKSQLVNRMLYCHLVLSQLSSPSIGARYACIYRTRGLPFFVFGNVHLTIAHAKRDILQPPDALISKNRFCVMTTS